MKEFPASKFFLSVQDIRNAMLGAHQALNMIEMMASANPQHADFRPDKYCMEQMSAWAMLLFLHSKDRKETAEQIKSIHDKLLPQALIFIDQEIAQAEAKQATKQ